MQMLLLLVTPEYNGSYTPALKNLFDHFPKQSRKPFGIVTASPGALGGMRAGITVTNACLCFVWHWFTAHAYNAFG